MKARCLWSGQGPLYAVFQQRSGEGDAYSDHARTPLREPVGMRFPSQPSMGVGRAVLLLRKVLAAVLNFGCHLCLQSEAEQGTVLPFDSSIYLANKPGYTIHGAPLPCRKMTGVGCDRISGK